MGKIAFVFSGQGAQYSGMGKSLYETGKSAKKLYAYAEEKRPGTMNQSFYGTAEELRETKNTQPCLYLVDISAALTLNENGIYADGVAGFSLGEMAALAYAGAYTAEDGFDIVTYRSLCMQRAAECTDTVMTAVLKVSDAAVEDICAGIDDVYPVNYNSPGQVVVAGTGKGIAVFKKKAEQIGARMIDLPVGAAFHSPFMDVAASEFGSLLSSFAIQKPSLSVYANQTGACYTEHVKEAMQSQMNHPVLWCKTIQNMINDGYDTFIECGAGKTLSGLIKKISKDVTVYAVQDAESLNQTVEAVKQNA